MSVWRTSWRPARLVRWRSRWAAPPTVGRLWTPSFNCVWKSLPGCLASLDTVLQLCLEEPAGLFGVSGRRDSTVSGRACRAVWRPRTPSFNCVWKRPQLPVTTWKRTALQTNLTFSREIATSFWGSGTAERETTSSANETASGVYAESTRSSESSWRRRKAVRSETAINFSARERRTTTSSSTRYRRKSDRETSFLASGAIWKIFPRDLRWSCSEMATATNGAETIFSEKEIRQTSSGQETNSWESE